MKKRVILIIFLLFPFIVNAETIPNQYDYDVITTEDTYIYDEDGQELTEIPAETELIIDSEKFLPKCLHSLKQMSTFAPSSPSKVT